MTPPTFDRSKPQDHWEFPIRIPIAKGEFGATCVETRGHIVSAVTDGSIQSNRFIAVANWLNDDRVQWCESVDRLLCRFDDDGRTLLAIDIASDEQRRELRVPVFIQDLNWPSCCGRSMQFVAQIDDNEICMEPPPDAELWWHDAASFYVFTCAKCLECKAIGQQF